MNAISSAFHFASQSVFINRQLESASKQAPLTAPNNHDIKDVKGVNNSVQTKSALQPIEGEFIKIGDSVSFSQAEALFESANRYSSVSVNANSQAINSGENSGDKSGEVINTWSAINSGQVIETGQVIKNGRVNNSAQNGLQAYTAFDIQNKRDDLRRLMGVDLYA